MRPRIGIVALILAVCLLAAVPAIRTAQEKAILADLAENRRYEAALYYAHVHAIDDTTSNLVAFELRWNTEEISPFSKGSGPTILESMSDGSKIISAVGVRLEQPLRIQVVAPGYDPAPIDIEAQGGGVLSQDSSRLTRTVRLTPSQPKGGS